MANPAFKQILENTKKAKATATKKQTMPEINPPAEVAMQVDEFNKAKEVKAQAEAIMAHAAEQIMALVREQQDRDGFAGNFNNSYQVKGMETAVKVVYQNRFSINPEDEPEIRKLVGKHFDELFQVKYTVKVKDIVFTNDKLGEEFAELVKERFNDFFENVQTLEIMENYNKKIYALVKPERLPALRIFVRQYKPSLK